MPLYEYECEACGHRFEVIQKFSDPPIETCPKCGGHVQKLASAPAFQFKGTGWYITDYAKKDASKKDASKKDSSSSPSEKSDASSPAGTDTSKESGSKTESTGSASADKPSTPAKSD